MVSTGELMDQDTPGETVINCIDDLMDQDALIFFLVSQFKVRQWNQAMFDYR